MFCFNLADFFISKKAKFIHLASLNRLIGYSQLFFYVLSGFKNFHRERITYWE